MATYDPLNRLISARNAGTDCTATVLGGNKKFWGNTYTYDAWGNLTTKALLQTPAPPACAGENLSVTADVHNWIHATGGADYQYDAAGNMTFNATPPTQTYTYDQENRLTGAAGYSYTYDGDGNRAIKSNGGTGTLYWYMTPGVVAETDFVGTLKSEYIFFDGERVARRDGATGTGGVFYYFSDHLKTASVITDSAGVIKAESDYYPWGGELQFVANDSNHYKFTGKERDGETQLDYFGARYYSNGLGRFVTSDWSAVPVPVPYADLSDPQSFNQYSYVRNIPTVKVDADGHDGGVGTDVEVDMELVKQTLRQLGPEGGVTGTVALAAIAVIGTAILVHEVAYPSTTVGQSNADEQAAIQQGSQERAAQNGGVDPQQAPEREASTSGAGARKGGGSKAADAPGVTAGNQATNKHGQKLSGSGRPQVNNVNKNTREAARNAANKGSGVIHDHKTKRGGPHFHTKKGNGDKKRDGTHYNYPK